MATEQESIALAKRLDEFLQTDDVASAVDLVSSIHPADQADLYTTLDPAGQEALLALLSADGLAKLLAHLDEVDQKEIVQRMPSAALARVLDKGENDIAVDILRRLPPADAARILSNMTTAAEIAPLLVHSDESAGGLMTRGYVALPEDMTVGEAVNFLRLSKPLAEEGYYLYVVDSHSRLEGVVSLRQLIVSDPSTPIPDVMTSEVISVTPDADQEEAARLLTHYRLRALPVVDEDGVLRGIITADDVIDVLTEEATEDIYHMVGLGVDESVLSPVVGSLKRRIPWLLVNLVTAFIAALTVSAFEDTISKVAILAAFMPIIAGHGGNAGTQSATLVVRGIALAEVTPSDVRQVAKKEVVFGLIHGFVSGLLTGALAFILSDNIWLALVVFAAMQFNLIIATLAGALIPLALRALRIDPALASAIWLTTFTDVVGFLMLLGLGTLLLSKLS